MIRLEPTLPDEATAEDEAAAAPASDMVVVSGTLLEQLIAALAPAADFAGDVRMIGRIDTEMLHPHLPARFYRRARELRRQLMQELAANA